MAHNKINAWILALGLTVIPDVKYEDHIYKEAWLFARAAMAGVLDWKSLVAWFFRRELTVEKDQVEVPADRHFNLTLFQEPAMGNGRLEGHEGLTQRMQSINPINDIPLGVFTEE
jgi:hypothetical protein